MAKRVKSETESELKERLLTTLRESLGIAYVACKKAGVDYDLYLKWRREDREFARRLETLDEIALDFVEGKALDAIGAGSERLIQFYLETKGRARGYTRDETKTSRRPIAILSEDELEY